MISNDTNPLLEVRGVSLTYEKLFDGFWHKGLMYKLKRLGISGKFYGHINSFSKSSMDSSKIGLKLKLLFLKVLI